MTRKLIEQMLDCIEELKYSNDTFTSQFKSNAAITAAREYLAQPSEPVAWLIQMLQGRPMLTMDKKFADDARDFDGKNITALYTHPPQPKAPEQSDVMFACGITPRPLQYPLSDYHVAMSEGPLHFTWTDKPHRLVYDLIAAVKYYAAPPQPEQSEPLTDDEIDSVVLSHMEDINSPEGNPVRKLNAYRALVRAGAVLAAQRSKE